MRWRSLPFDNQDEDFLRRLGYSDEFILFMKRMHRRAVKAANWQEILDTP